MNIGKKINLVIAGVTITALGVAFAIIVGIEASSIERQMASELETVANVVRDDVERILKPIKTDNKRPQAIVDELGATEGVNHIEVIGVDGYYLVAVDPTFVGKKINEVGTALIEQIKNTRQVVDLQTDKGANYLIERYVPVYEIKGDATSGMLGIVGAGVVTRSKSANDVLDAQKLLKVISLNIVDNAQFTTSAVSISNEDIDDMKNVVKEVDRYASFQDFTIFDNKLHVIASTEDRGKDLENDTSEYSQLRDDVLVDKKTEAVVERMHNGVNVLVRIVPITVKTGWKIERVGVVEVHLITSVYRDRITALILRMFGIGVILIAVIVGVIAFILRKEVVEPIVRYSRIAQKVADGDLNQKIENLPQWEIGRIGEVFNLMVANLRDINHLKTDFLTVAAHQLRTPLSSVKWALKLLLDSDVGPINEDQRSMLARCFETNDKMTKMVDDLLNVSRIEGGKSSYKFERNDFADTLNILIENSKLNSQERGVELRLENNTDISSFIFDKEKISIALQNFIDNGLKYTLPGGNVLVVVEREGDYVKIKVIDTGVGIPKDEIPRLFSKFFRATNVVYLQTEGSGLGLVIAKSIIVAHGGQILVESVEGKGTTFTVKLPLLAELLPKEKAPSIDEKNTMSV